MLLPWSIYLVPIEYRTIIAQNYHIINGYINSSSYYSYWKTLLNDDTPAGANEIMHKNIIKIDPYFPYAMCCMHKLTTIFLFKSSISFIYIVLNKTKKKEENISITISLLSVNTDTTFISNLLKYPKAHTQNSSDKYMD